MIKVRRVVTLRVGPKQYNLEKRQGSKNLHVLIRVHAVIRKKDVPLIIMSMYEIVSNNKKKLNCLQKLEAGLHEAARDIKKINPFCFSDQIQQYKNQHDQP